MKEHIRMGFGRYRGVPVDQVPLEYAKWLMSQPNPPKGWLAEDLQARAQGKVPVIRNWSPKPPDEVLGGETPEPRPIRRHDDFSGSGEKKSPANEAGLS